MLRFPALSSKVVASMMLAALAFVAGQVARAAPFPYVNDFTSEGLTNMAPQYTLDTDNGVLNVNHPLEGGTLASVASEQITGLGASDFVVSTRFTVNSLEGGGNAISVGFGVLGATADLVSTSGPYYLVDWSLGGGAAATLRILNLGTTPGTFSAVNANPNPDKAMAGETYEMRLTGTYTSGTLDMSVVVLDSVGNQLGNTATATHDTPFTGEYFGYRNRTAHPTHLLDVNFDHFSVTSPTTPLVPGDFDGDGDVDGADFVVWQTNFPKAEGGTLDTGDADGDGDVDGADFVVWQTNFPFTPSPGVSPVPEPHSVLLSAIGIAGLGLLVRRRRK